ncbi:MAG: hypothetical protein FWF78_01805 [Defluviitaleaceae bacterium]|nr:hypothetical protein [Defluviitaleaceae bacterium]
MRVEINLDPDISEETAIIHAKKMTPKLLNLVEALERADDEKTSMLVAKNDDKVFIIDPGQVDIIRTEGGEIKLYERDIMKPLDTE